jgi:hypothetical protein
VLQYRSKNKAGAFLAHHLSESWFEMNVRTSKLLFQNLNIQAFAIDKFGGMENFRCMVFLSRLNDLNSRSVLKALR